MLSKKLKDLREDRDLYQKDIANKLGISQSALSMYENGTREPSIELLQSFADFYKVSLDYLTGRTDINNVKIVEMPKTVQIPVIGSVPCGVPVEAIEDVIDMVDIPATWTKGGEQYMGLLVTGDSMEPEYLAGDIVIIRLTEDFNNGDDCVVYVNGYDATLKRIKKQGNAVILTPLNSKYETKIYKADQVKVCGVVKEMRRSK